MATQPDGPGTIRYVINAVGFHLSMVQPDTTYSFDVLEGHQEVVVHVWDARGDTAPDHVCDDLRDWLKWNAVAVGVGVAVIGRRVQRLTE